MRKLIVDTNIILSYLHTQNPRILSIIDDDEVQIYTPNYLIYEFIKHQQRIMAKSKLDNAEYAELIGFLISRLYFINIRDIDFVNISYALRLCGEVDENDTMFVALSLQLDCLLRTRDDVLKTGLRQRGFDNFFST